ncbi:MAG TPA: ABC transporter permease [Thermomicrobiales bacterium]|nr:ABC transporter permease [Thermomicrobiales bacterium]
MSQIQLAVEPTLELPSRRESRFRSFWRPFVASKMGPVGLVILIAVALCAIFAGVIAPDGPFKLGGPRLVGPGEDGYLLGTDHLGRSMTAQLVYGARVSLSVGVIAASISLIVGVFFGCIAGYFGGWIDILISRMTDMFLIIPAFFLIIVVVATLGSGITYVMIVIGLTSWPTSARLMRAQAMSLRERTFIQGLKALGESSPRILFRHIIPNGIQPLIANASLDIASAILIEAGLSFLGLGDPNKATWGRMIFDGRATILTAWWTSVLPGIAIVITVLGFYLLGDGISYVLNPRSRKVTA